MSEDKEKIKLLKTASEFIAVYPVDQAAPLLGTNIHNVYNSRSNSSVSAAANETNANTQETALSFNDGV